MALALISGGSGLIGTALSKFLLVRGHRVVILTRNTSIQPTFGESAVWDGIHPGQWMDWVPKADWIINLAGENIGANRWTEKRLRQILESRVFPGELLAEAVSRSSSRPSAFMQMSAVGYYGVQSRSDMDRWDELTPPGSDRLAEICREWEASSDRVEELGVRRLIIRSGLVLSAKGGVLSRLELPFRFFVGGPLGDGKQVYSWIHLDDLINAMYTLLQNPAMKGAYNLTAPQPATSAEFSKTIGRVLHRPAWFRVPSFALRLMLGEMASMITDGQRVIPARLLNELGYMFKYPTLESALRHIHLQK